MIDSDNQILVFLVFIIFVLAGVVLFLVTKKGSNSNDAKSFQLLQQHLFDLSHQLERKLNETHKTLDSKLSESNKYLSENIQKTFLTSSKIWEESNKKIEEITKKLTELGETNKQIKDIGGQLEWLERILTNPKQRGVLGEYFLETILKNMFPPENYEMQYKFKNGEIVDAVIKIQGKIIPIDSKFSLENYTKIVESGSEVEREIYEKEFKKDLKKRIDETSKYIRPSEKTMEFAFMFIPSEGIYYDILINKVGAMKINTADLIEYAFKEKHVIIVSPTSFYAYLQTVMQWLKALQIEEAAKDIQKQVGQLWKHLQAYEEYLKKLGNTLGTTVNHYNNAYKEFNKIEKDVVKITGVQWEQEILQLEKPEE